MSRGRCVANQVAAYWLLLLALGFTTLAAMVGFYLAFIAPIL